MQTAMQEIRAATVRRQAGCTGESACRAGAGPADKNARFPVQCQPGVSMIQPPNKHRARRDVIGRTWTQFTANEPIAKVLMRVLSLLPSATETLCAIEGGAAMLVGRSHECDYPAGVTHLPILTAQRTHATTSAEIDAEVRAALSTKDACAEGASNSLYFVDEDLLRSLEPDVILTQDLCDVCSIDLRTVERIAESMSPTPRVVSLNPLKLEDIFDDVLRVGEAVKLDTEAQAAVVGLRTQYWSAIDYVNPYISGEEVAFLEWMDPLFCAGHWTPQLIEAAGGTHSLNKAGEKSRRIEPEELLETMPQRLIICPCGYNIKQIRSELNTLTSQRWWKLLPAVQDGNVMLVDGNQMFNRPGPRLVDAFRWLVAWLNDRPEVLPKAFPVEAIPAPSPLGRGLG